MRVRASDAIVSTLAALFLTSLFSIIYKIDPISGWPYLLSSTIIIDTLILFILQNQAKNYKKWEKHPTTFPNPIGGGLLGEYMERPWHNELDALAQQKKSRSNNDLDKKDRATRRRAKRTHAQQKDRAK